MRRITWHRNDLILSRACMHHHNGADEGFMATGYASNATDAAVQANIVAVGYKTDE